jgi:hypothetical protein
MQQCFINKNFIILYLSKKEMKVRINTIVIYLVIGLSLAMLPDLKAQSLLSWEKLSDVNFDLVWFEEHQSKFMVPRFGAIPNSYKNKKVKINILIRGKINFGGFFILAPENACAGKTIKKEWKEVWQYGANLEPKTRNAPCLQDGVAAQTKAKGLGENNRVFFPKENEKNMGFFWGTQKKA